MKKLLTLSIALTLLSLSLIAQQTQYQWVKSAGGSFITGGATANNTFDGYAEDKSGNTYISGSVVQGMTFGDSIINRPYGSFGAYDAMFAKYDKCGKLLWYQVIGTKSSDYSGSIALAPDGRSFITLISLAVSHNDTAILHMENRDTVIKTGYGCYLKISTETGKIIKIWPANIPYPTGATYQPSQITYISSNRIVAFPTLIGNYNGVIESGYEGIIAILDSNLNIIRSREIDSGLIYYFANDYDWDRPSLEVDKYGNIYNKTILCPSDPSNTLRLFDTVFSGFAHGDGVLFQLDSNLNLKRFKKTNAIPTLHISADDNLYVTGGADTNYYYDQTRFYGNGTNNYQHPIYIKIDTSLELKGYSYPVYDQFVQDMNLIKATTDKVYVAGLGFGNFKWGLDSINSIPNEYQISLWEFPKDSVRPTKVHLTDGFGINTAFPVYIGTDEQGNVSIGGTYGLALYTAADSVYAAGGMNSPNLYTLHWGLDCVDSIHSLIAPLEPAALVATASSAHAVQVTWQDASRYEHSFHIYRSPDGVSSWTRIDSTLANTTQYIDVNVQPHTAYWYRVAAWNENGESSFTNIDSALTWMDVGIAETEATAIYLYPNPNKGTFTLLTSGTTHSDYTITDMLGAVIEQKPITTDRQTIDLNTVPAGVYTLSVKGSPPLRFVIVR